MKEIITTCVVESGTQMWWRDSQTGKTSFTVQPTSPGYEFKEDIKPVITWNGGILIYNPRGGTV